jgi:signal transduction histidine kinase
MRLRNLLGRISGKIFVSFTALLAGLTLILSLTGLEFAQNTIAANAANELRLLSVILSRQVQRRLYRIEESLTFLENHTVLLQELRKQPPDRDAIETVLDARLKNLPLFHDLAVFNRAGVCVAATDSRWFDINGQNKPFFTNGLKAFNFSDMAFEEEGKIQIVSVPIRSGPYVRGVLVGHVNLSSIYELMDQKLGVSETTDAFLLDSALRFITPGKSGTDRLLESHLAATPLMRHLKEEFWVDQYKNYSGQSVLGTVHKIPGRQWYVVVERDIEEVRRPVATAKKAIFAAAACLIIILIIPTYFLSRSITRPLLILVEDAQKIAQGQFNHPFTIPKGTLEVQFLASEFDKMRAKIAAFQERLIERLEESERKRIDSERLAAIGTLASTMAHEIRNPLNAMSLLLTRLPLAIRSGAEPETIVLDLRGEINRLDRLVSDILDFAKPLHLSLQDLNLCQLIKDVVGIYRDYFEKNGINCVFQKFSDSLMLRGDPDKLKQCFVNLLQNAMDSMLSGGFIEIDAEREGDFVKVWIRDNGMGLPLEAEGRLFDLFFTTKEKGTGIGLSTVKKIVDAHGGRISLRRRAYGNSKAMGTEVFLSFPALPA